MKLSANFTLEEFVQSDTAARLGIDNALPADLMADAIETADMMERIRAYLSKQAGRNIPVHVSSGYRSLALNRAIGSKDTSDHVLMQAIDFKAPDFGPARTIARALAPAVDVLKIGQLIFEFDSWVHVSRRVPAKYMNRILTANAQGFIVGV